MGKRSINIVVGFFMLLGIIGVAILALRVSGLTSISGDKNDFVISAEFDNIGSLKPDAQVSVSGVTVGRVASITLDPKTFRAKVVMRISAHYNYLPSDSSASILTLGLLGANYISLTPGFSTTALTGGSEITVTHSALVLENLIGQLMFSLKSGGAKTNAPSAK